MPIANINVAERKSHASSGNWTSVIQTLYWTVYLCMFVYVLILLCYINCWHYSQM